MAVDAISSATNAGTTNSTLSKQTASAQSLDYNAFLKLLIAQLQNQDPLQPMDSTEYVAQLATFSQVEQTMKTNTKLDDILVSTRLSDAESLIGRTVTSAKGDVSGEISSVRIDSKGATATLVDGKSIPLGAGVTIS